MKNVFFRCSVKTARPSLTDIRTPGELALLCFDHWGGEKWSFMGGGSKITYWHSELPPLNAEAIGEHTVEANSGRVPGTLAHRDELWNQCYEDLMAQLHIRLEQELARLGGDYAHVLDEFVESKHDGVTGEAWLHGFLTYMLYHAA